MCSSTRSDGAVLRAALAPAEERDAVSRALLLLFYHEHCCAFRRRELRMLHHLHFAIIDAASFAQRRRSWDLGHSDLGPQWCARSGNKSAFFAVVVAIVSRLKTGLPKWAIWAPASTFRRLVLRSGASHVLGLVGPQPAPASISVMHKRS